MREREKDIQRACEDLLDRLRMRYVHIPGHMQRWLRQSAPPHIARIASRYLKGIPDLIVFREDGRYLLLELKTTNGRLSTHQRAWSEGLPLVVAYGLDDAINAILSFHRGE